MHDLRVASEDTWRAMIDAARPALEGRDVPAWQLFHEGVKL